MTWEKLGRTDDTAIRHCEICSRNVHYCASDKEAIEQAKLGHCVAIEMVDESEKPVLMIGRPTNPEPITKDQEEALRIRQIELQKIRALKDLKFSDRFCPDCGFPIASFRKTCWVCEKTE